MKKCGKFTTMAMVEDMKKCNNFIVYKNSSQTAFLHNQYYYANKKDLPLFLYMKYCEIVYLKKIGRDEYGTFYFFL